MAVWRVTLSCSVDGQVCQNVLHLTASDGILPNTVTDIMRDQWLPQIRPFQHTGARWFDIEARRVDPIGLAPFHQTIVQFGSGDTEREADNPCLARVLQFKTAVAGRHGRGRIYIPGTTQASWDKGFVKTASLTAGQPLVNSLMNSFCNPNPPFGLRLVLSRRSNPSQTINVDTIVQAPRIGVQRRRNIGVGM